MTTTKFHTGSEYTGPKPHALSHTIRGKLRQFPSSVTRTEAKKLLGFRKPKPEEIDPVLSSIISSAA